MAWFNVFKKSGEVVQAVADEFDALAAIVRFASIKERSFAFYQKHRLVVDAALEFVSALRRDSRELGLMLSGSSDPTEKTARILRKRVAELQLPQAAQALVNTGSKELVLKFAPMLADTSRPAYLDECRWVIESCAEKLATAEAAEAYADAEE